MKADIFLNMRKFLAPEIVYGEGAIALTGNHAINMGATKAMIVSDPGVEAHGWLKKVETTLQEVGLSYVTFTDITENPKDHEVMAGADMYRNERCDFIIAVGGGSPMDCAKGIGTVVTNGGHITDFEGIDEIPTPLPPLLFIPTTAGTSADVSQFAIIIDTKRMVKITIISKMVIPDIALIDPGTTRTMDPALTAATGMDALCHALEAYVSSASSPLTDMAAKTAVELIFKNILGAYVEPDRMYYRSNMMMASLMAGLAFSNASLGLVHAMAHSLGGALGLPHGECNALLLEKVVLFNYPEVSEKYQQLAEPMGLKIRDVRREERGQAISLAIATLRKRLNIDYSLSGMGVSPKDIPQLTHFAFKDPCLATNPRACTREDIEGLFRLTMN